jgi:hypothetical protein
MNELTRPPIGKNKPRKRRQLFSFTEKIALLISGFFHPLTIPTYMFAVLFRYFVELVPLSLQGKTALLIQVFVFSFIMPAAVSSTLYVSGGMKSMISQSRQERTLPLLISAIIYSGASWVYVFVLKADKIISLTFLSITICVFLGVVGNRFLKISLHGIGIGGALGYFLAIQNHHPEPEFMFPFVVIVLLSGLAIWSRFALNAHSQKEIYLGLFLGMLGGSAPIMLILQSF